MTEQPGRADALDDGGVVEHVEVEHIPEPEEPDPGVMDPTDTYVEGIDK